MDIKIDDLFVKSPKKEKRYTVVVDPPLDELIDSLRKSYGKKNVAEIMRRVLKVGLSQVANRMKDDQAS